MTNYVMLDLEPLMTLVGRRLGARPHRHTGCPCCSVGVGGCLSSEAVARELGVSSRAVKRWRRSGMVPRFVADRICDRLGVHPTTVWGHDYYAAPAA